MASKGQKFQRYDLECKLKVLKEYKACLIDLKKSGTTYEFRIYEEKLNGKDRYSIEVFLIEKMKAILMRL